MGKFGGAGNYASILQALQRGRGGKPLTRGQARRVAGGPGRPAGPGGPKPWERGRGGQPIPWADDTPAMSPEQMQEVQGVLERARGGDVEGARAAAAEMQGRGGGNFVREAIARNRGMKLPPTNPLRPSGPMAVDELAPAELPAAAARGRQDLSGVQTRADGSRFIMGRGGQEQDLGAAAARRVPPPSGGIVDPGQTTMSVGGPTDTAISLYEQPGRLTPAPSAPLTATVGPDGQPVIGHGASSGVDVSMSDPTTAQRLFPGGNTGIDGPGGAITPYTGGHSGNANPQLMEILNKVRMRTAVDAPQPGELQRMTVSTDARPRGAVGVGGASPGAVTRPPKPAGPAITPAEPMPGTPMQKPDMGPEPIVGKPPAITPVGGGVSAQGPAFDEMVGRLRKKGGILGGGVIGGTATPPAARTGGVARGRPHLEAR